MESVRQAFFSYMEYVRQAFLKTQIRLNKRLNLPIRRAISDQRKKPTEKAESFRGWNLKLFII